MAGGIATANAPKSLDDLKTLLKNDIKVKVAGQLFPPTGMLDFLYAYAGHFGRH